jgi:hypothetical protein
LLKIDYSTIALILALVLPGLGAKKSRRKICAQSFESAGQATELGALVGLSSVVHLILLFGSAVLAVFVAVIKGQAASTYFRAVDLVDYSSWSNSHRSEAVLAVGAYLCVSLVAGYILGLLNGWFMLTHPIGRLVKSRTQLTVRLEKLGIFGLFGERPLSFEIFTGEAVSRKTDLVYFLEIRLRDDKGFVTGKLASYAIVKDEEVHRPVLLQDAQFKLAADDAYQPMEGDRVLIDLADALLVQVSYRERELASQDIDEE